MVNMIYTKYDASIYLKILNLILYLANSVLQVTTVEEEEEKPQCCNSSSGVKDASVANGCLFSLSEAENRH